MQLSDVAPCELSIWRSRLIPGTSWGEDLPDRTCFGKVLLREGSEPTCLRGYFFGGASPGVVKTISFVRWFTYWDVGREDGIVGCCEL